MRKYKAGDRVRVKYFDYKPLHWVNNMKIWMGKEVTIKNLNGGAICIKNDKYEYAWRESDFESLDFLSDKDFSI